MQRLKKLLLKNYQVFIISLFAISIISSRMIFAADDWATTQSVGGYWKAATSGEVNQEGWWAKSLGNTVNFFSGAIGGCDNSVDQDCPLAMGTGVNGALASAVVNLTNTPPASSVEYLADLGKNLGIIPQAAYAQNGPSWQGFLPVLPIWKAFRNIAYLALVIIFVIIGFMIMFRKKLNPQTVISVQEAIPKLVVTLLLITFSYAIASVILDITLLSTRVVANTFQETGLIAIPRAGETKEQKVNTILEGNIFRLTQPLINTRYLVDGIARVPGQSLGIGKQIIGGAIAGLVGLIFTVTGFFLEFKIFFALIGPYVQLVLAIVFAPFNLLMGAIPGNNNALTKWIKGLLANAAVFPVTLTMLFITAIFKSAPVAALGIPAKNFWDQIPWVPVDWSTKIDRIGINFPAAGIGNWGGMVGELVGFGILFTIPKVAELTKAVIMGKEAPGGELALGEIKKSIGKIPGLGQVVS